MIFTLEYFIGLILIGVVAGFASGLLGVGRRIFNCSIPVFPVGVSWS